MSTILKALRRVEDDRSSRSGRPLRDEVVGGSTSPSPRRRRGRLLLGVLALCVGVGAGALAFWSVDGVDGETAEPSATAPKLAAARPQAVEGAKAARAARAGRASQGSGGPNPTVRRRTRPVPPQPLKSPSEPPPMPSHTRGLPPEALASDVAVLDRPARQPRITAPEEPADAEAGRPAAPSRPASAAARRAARRSAPTRADAVSRPPPPPAPVAKSEPKPEPPPVAKPEPTPEPRIASAPKPEPTPPPVVPEPAPAPRKSPVSDIRVERTVWHPLAERRLATVEVKGEAPRELREGDSVGSLVVEKIEPSGVVFVHEGVEFKRRIGED